ncbi:SPOSA6832_02449 [Sporobolomyces salmonicolor]|uniref:SPOSA6832_02449-mRNA-1:cds n=1 Tax=Sporidiobolus salmonicolor TaxID=5005 RepID=A0A0D6ELL8_SPOSA|nr:SPOSA6832_02449 [Sporobolomyces salmonicolor]
MGSASFAAAEGDSASCSGKGSFKPSLRPLPPVGIASLSLGAADAGHTLPSKLIAAARAGFTSLELFDLDWQNYRDAFARERSLPLPATEGDPTSKAAAGELGRLAREHGIEFSCWQPLRNFEGFVDDEDRRKSRVYAKGILDVMPLLGTTLLLCCTTSTPSPATTGDLSTCAADLAWLTDEAAARSPAIRVMYEALSKRWQDAWEVIEKVNKPNLGLCLDSFNTLALEWADPYKPDGKLSDDVDEKLEENMAELVRRVPGDKIYLYQVADGRFMSPPLAPPTDPAIPRLRPWSRSHRLFPLEHSLGAYLPVDTFSDAVIATGYTGEWSLEVFNDSLSEKGPEVPASHAKRGMEALGRAVREAYERAGKAW